MKTFSILLAVLASALLLNAADKDAPAAALEKSAAAAPAAAVTETNATPKISRRVADVIKLSKAGLDAAFIKTYLANAGDGAPLTVNEVLYLREQGVNQDVITAMVERGGPVRAYANQLATQDDRTRDAMMDARQRAMFQQSYPTPDRGYYYDAPYFSGYASYSHGRGYRGPLRPAVGNPPPAAAPGPINRPPFAVQPLRGSVR